MSSVDTDVFGVPEVGLDWLRQGSYWTAEACEAGREVHRSRCGHCCSCGRLDSSPRLWRFFRLGSLTPTSQKVKRDTSRFRVHPARILSLKPTKKELAVLFFCVRSRCTTSHSTLNAVGQGPAFVLSHQRRLGASVTVAEAKAKSGDSVCEDNASP